MKNNTPVRNSKSPLEEMLALHAKLTAVRDKLVAVTRSALPDAIRLGELLTAQKAKLDHGEWLPWLEANMPFDRMTANRYMRVFERKDELNVTGVLHLTEAYRLLAPPPEPEETFTPEQFRDAYELTAIAAFSCMKRGHEVTPDECVELGLALMRGQTMIRFDNGRCERFKDGEWLPITEGEKD